jgi:hypothetical protein
VTDQSLRAVEVFERAGAPVGDTDERSAAWVEAVAVMAGTRGLLEFDPARRRSPRAGSPAIVQEM